MGQTTERGQMKGMAQILQSHRRPCLPAWRCSHSLLQCVALFWCHERKELQINNSLIVRGEWSLQLRYFPKQRKWKRANCKSRNPPNYSLWNAACVAAWLPVKITQSHHHYKRKRKEIKVACVKNKNIFVVFQFMNEKAEEELEHNRTDTHDEFGMQENEINVFFFTSKWPECLVEWLAKHLSVEMRRECVNYV